MNRLVRMPDHVVAELALVAVDAGVEVVAAARDLRRDEAALVGVDERAVGHADLGDGGQLCVPEGAHVREVRGRSRPPRRAAAALGHGSAAAEPVGDDDVVVVDGVVRGDGVGGAVERDEGRRRPAGRPSTGVARRVGDVDAAVDRDEGIAADDDAVGELGDGDRGAAADGERRHLCGQVAVGVGPGGPLAVVDAEAVVLEEPVGAVLDEERAAEARDDAVVVAEPPMADAVPSAPVKASVSTLKAQR